MKYLLRFKLYRPDLDVVAMEHKIAGLGFRNISCSYHEDAIVTPCFANHRDNSKLEYIISSERIWSFEFSNRKSLDDDKKIDNIDTREIILFLASICDYLHVNITLECEEIKFSSIYTNSVVKLTNEKENVKYNAICRGSYWEFNNETEQKKYAAFLSSGKYDFLELPYK